jgi:hypothetical protein
VFFEINLVRGEIGRMTIVFTLVEALPVETKRFVLLLEFVGALLQASVRVVLGLRHDCCVASAGGGNRTRTTLLESSDFKSDASASSATPARGPFYAHPRGRNGRSPRATSLAP